MSGSHRLRSWLLEVFVGGYPMNLKCKLGLKLDVKLERIESALLKSVGGRSSPRV